MDDIIRKILKDDTLTAESEFSTLEATELARHGFKMKMSDKDIIWSIEIESQHNHQMCSNSCIVEDELTGLKKLQMGWINVFDLEGNDLPIQLANLMQNHTTSIIHSYTEVK